MPLVVDAVRADELEAETFARLALRKQAGNPMERYYRRPDLFVLECIRWKDNEDGPALYQLELLRALAEHGRVSARGPHGLGKTALQSWVLLWFTLTRDAAGVDWKAPTTASVWRQLSRYLWPEIHKWARRLDWEKIGRAPFREGRELLDLSIQLEHGQAFALASDDPTALEGAHADSILYLFDESKSIPGETFDACEGAFSGAGGDTGREAFALMTSTPGEPNGRFYEVQKRAQGTEDWTVRHVTLAECIAAGRVSSEWVEQRRKQWGERSAVFQNRVLGDFAASAENAVIPLAWIEGAVERWQQWQETGGGTLTSVGADVGDVHDLTVLAPVYDRVKVGALQRYGGEGTMAAAGRIEAVLRGTGARAVVDSIGIGSGTLDRLRERERMARPSWSAVGFIASAKSLRRDRGGQYGFVDLRSEAWWNLREMLDPDYDSEVALPPDDEMIGDLTAPTYQVESGGKYRVEKKDDIKKRLGRSTDAGDAVVMGLHVELPSVAAVTAPKAKPRPLAYQRKHLL